MRLLRYVMLLVALMLVVLTAVMWQRSLYVVSFENSNAVSIHFEGHRGFIVEVSPNPKGLTVTAAEIVAAPWKCRSTCRVTCRLDTSPLPSSLLAPLAQTMNLRIATLHAQANGIALGNGFADSIARLNIDRLKLDNANSAVTYGKNGAVAPQGQAAVRHGKRWTMLFT